MKRFYFILLIILFFSSSGYTIEIPELQGRVNDYADIISSSAESRIVNKLKNFEKNHSSQIAILTVKSLKNYSIEQFSIQVAEKWKIGQKEKDNGVILVVSKEDRKMRIEVGYGLEKSLTDLMSGRIIRNIIAPEFKKGNFDKGFVKGVEGIISVIKNDYKNNEALTSAAGENKKEKSSGSLIPFLVFLGFLIFSGKSKLVSGIMGALIFPFILLILLPSLPALLLIVLAVPGFFIGMVFSLFSGFAPGVFYGGGFSSGGGFGSGGFSGGGGGFGGGGASGGW